MNWDYISGFFDADGYITMYKKAKNENESPTIGVTNTRLDLLEEMRDFIQQQTGIRGLISSKAAKKANHAISYDLKYVGFFKVTVISKYLNSHHEKKRTRLALLPSIKELTPRNGKYTEDVLKKRALLVSKFLSIK